MRRLLDVCMNSLISRFTQEFTSEDLWELTATRTRLKLNEGQKFLKYFSDTVTQYTSQLWTQSRKWSSGAMNLKPVASTLTRISEVLELREQLEELSRMQNIGGNGKFRADFETPFYTFKAMNCLNASALSADSWNSAKIKFEQQMEVTPM